MEKYRNQKREEHEKTKLETKGNNYSAIFHNRLTKNKRDA